MPTSDRLLYRYLQPVAQALGLEFPDRMARILNQHGQANPTVSALSPLCTCCAHMLKDSLLHACASCASHCLKRHVPHIVEACRVDASLLTLCASSSLSWNCSNLVQKSSGVWMLCNRKWATAGRRARSLLHPACRLQSRRSARPCTRLPWTKGKPSECLSTGVLLTDAVMSAPLATALLLCMLAASQYPASALWLRLRAG